MKVLSVLALCAVLFFAVTYAHQTEDEEQAIEQNGIEQAFEEEDEERALQQDKMREQDTEGAQMLQNAKAQTRLIPIIRRIRYRYRFRCTPWMRRSRFFRRRCWWRPWRRRCVCVRYPCRCYGK